MILFLATIDEPITRFSKLCKKFQNEKGATIAKITSDHGSEFENHEFESFYDGNRIDHEFLASRPPSKIG